MKEREEELWKWRVWVWNEVKQNLIERDRIDSEREISPLKQADDAILIDNTELNKEQTIALILSYIQK